MAFPNDNDKYHEFDFFKTFNDVLQFLGMDNLTQPMTVEEIEMEDCAFLWDLGIRADEDLVRPPLKPAKREKYLTRWNIS